MDISQLMPESLTIEEPNGKCLFQEIEYEWKPSYCQDCLQIGKHKDTCKKTKTDVPAQAKPNPRRRKQQKQPQ